MRFVAIADIQADRRVAVKAMADKQNGDDKCAVYRDFRELLERDDIDAVLIATGGPMARSRVDVGGGGGQGCL